MPGFLINRAGQGKTSMATTADQSNRRTGRRARQAGAILARQIRAAGESRGFAVSRVLTHWSEIAGERIAGISRPVEVTYGKGFGATLVLLTNGANAPILEMEREALREKVNACYGYAAISRIRITQTAAQGFFEPAAPFDHKPAEKPPELSETSKEALNTVENAALRAALDSLGRNIVGRKTKPKGTA